MDPGRPLPDAVTGVRPHVLVIIPCYDEADHIEQKLRNTIALEYTPKTIVVVDDYSSDQTFEKAQTVAQQDALVLRNDGAPGKNSAVATALKRVPSDLACVTDADVLVAPDALTTLVACFADERVGAAFGRRGYVSRQQWERGELRSSRLKLEDYCIHVLRMLETRIDSVAGSHAEFLVFRRTGEDAIEAGIRCDDVELAFRTRARGRRVVYLPTTHYFELMSDDRMRQIRQRYRRGQATQERFLKHLGILFNPRYGWFGTVCFPLEFLLYVIQPIVVFSLAGLAAWMLVRFGWTHPEHTPMLVGGSVLLVWVPSMRRYLMLNAILFSGLVSTLTGQRVSDRWT